MDANRLEELQAKCAEVLAQDAPDIAGLIELRDFADLARCAAAWAKVEDAMVNEPSFVQLLGYRIKSIPWAWIPGPGISALRFCGRTAIEAVEAAEVAG